MRLYQLLQVPVGASDEELKKAFRSQVLKLHPDKSKCHGLAPEEVQKNEEQLCKLSSALKVLLNPVHRAQYDLYGDAGLKNIVSNNCDGPSRYQFNPVVQSSLKGLEEFFPEAYAEYTQAQRNSVASTSSTSTQDTVAIGAASASSLHSAAGQMACNMIGKKRPLHHQQQIEFALSCKLEELYTGTRKLWKVKRGQGSDCQEEVLEIVVRPGWREGTRITFEGEAGYFPCSLQDGVSTVLTRGVVAGFTTSSKLHYVQAPDQTNVALLNTGFNFSVLTKQQPKCVLTCVGALYRIKRGTTLCGICTQGGASPSV